MKCYPKRQNPGVEWVSASSLNVLNTAGLGVVISLVGLNTRRTSLGLPGLAISKGTVGLCHASKGHLSTLLEKSETNNPSLTTFCSAEQTLLH